MTPADVTPAVVAAHVTGQLDLFLMKYQRELTAAQQADIASLQADLALLLPPADDERRRFNSFIAESRARCKAIRDEVTGVPV